MCVKVILLILYTCLLLPACTESTDARAALRHGSYASAFELTQARAQAGDVAAQTALGTHYYLGVGVARDYARAFHWYGRAALAGDPHAQRNLGSLFRQGMGTPKDDFRAFGWYAESFKNGNPNAQFYMRWMALVVGTNQQALGRRLIAKDFQAQHVSEGVAKQRGR